MKLLSCCPVARRCRVGAFAYAMFVLVLSGMALNVGGTVLLAQSNSAARSVVLKPDNGTVRRVLTRDTIMCGVGVEKSGAVPHGVVAQDTGAHKFDSKGRRFWVAFMDNFGSGGDGEKSDLRLYVSCDRPTTVHLRYFATTQTADVDVPEANVAVEIRVRDLFGDFVELSPGDRGVSNKTIQVNADDDITLYGVNIRQMSSDAFLGLPDDVLTRRYIVLGYTNGYNTQSGSYDMPSEFAVIAIENGTELQIKPSAQLNSFKDKQPFVVTLDSGQVFYAEADVSSEQDVSGTEIRATKPIAVFGGNRRTAIPTNVGNFRDHLVEQLPPLEAWGREAIITPHFNITAESRYTAVVRVLAAFDGTSWTLNGVARQPMRAARPVEIPLRDEPLVIKADQPILVAQYEHSVGDVTDFGQGYSLGDPFMMIVSPPEQYDTAYAFQCVNHQEFLTHFVNVVIPTDAIRSLTIDDVAMVDIATFMEIPDTRFSYAQIQLSAGAHYARADSGFGLYVYGFGRANSYGYPGGTLFRTLVSDFQPPEIQPIPGCGEMTGLVYDSHITDTGVDSCYATGETKNVDLTIGPFVSGVDTVRYHAVLRDPYQDGRVGIKAIDSGGRSLTRVVDIPGFTIRAVGMVGNVPQAVDTLVVFNGLEFCRSVELENYGAFPRTITSVGVASSVSSTLKINAPVPMVLAPGERRPIQICYSGAFDTVYTVSLKISSECVDRTVATVPIVSRIDTSGPAITRVGDACSGGYTLSAAEPRYMQSGVASVQFDQLVNCRATLAPDSADLPTTQLTTTLVRIDERQDMIYRMRVRDAVGNEDVIADTIPGFTLAVTGLRGDQLALRLERDLQIDSLVLDGRRCDSVVLNNYGLKTLRLTTVRMRGNQSFSIPPSQLPVILAPGEGRKISICIEGVRAGEIEDTLLVEGECGINEEVAMKAPVNWIMGTGHDQCNNAISLQMYAPTKRTFMAAPVPNPVVSGTSYIDLGLTSSQTVRLEVVGLNGNVAMPVLTGVELPAGINRVEFDLSRLDSGPYFCRLITSSGEVFVEKLVIGR